MQVHVVSTRTTGTGGFDWFYNKPDAEQFYAQEQATAATFTDPADRYVPRYVGEVTVPDGLDRDGITTWLDTEGVDVWDFDLDSDFVDAGPTLIVSSGAPVYLDPNNAANPFRSDPGA